MGRWSDLTGKPHPLSTADAHPAVRRRVPRLAGPHRHDRHQPVRAAVHRRESRTRRTRSPSSTSRTSTARGSRAASPASCIPYNNPVRQPSGRRAGSLIPVDIALGKGDFYDVGALVSDEIGSAEMYYRFLNCGFRIAATSGTDNFSDVCRDPPPGADRAYVQIAGPLTLALVDGRNQGAADVRLDGTAAVPRREREGAGGRDRACRRRPRELEVKVEAVSIAPLESSRSSSTAASRRRSSPPIPRRSRSPAPCRGARTAAGSPRASSGPRLAT